MPATALPALKGDGHGRYRILIVGNSGTGKSTLLRRLAKILGIPALSLDLIHFKPGWVQYPTEVFRERVSDFIQKNPEYILDGNYSKVFDLTSSAATDIIWLDPPAVLYWPRVFIRTMKRILGIPQAELVPEGCRETFRSVFARDSILLWAVTHHSTCRKRYGPLWKANPVEEGGKWRRLGGWGREAEEWLEAVEELTSENQRKAVDVE